LKYRAVPRSGPEAIRGQSLAEFAIVFPVLFLIVAAIIQYGLVFWAQNTLTQIARDTGRWASTQQSCDPVVETPLVIQTANQIASSSALFGYQTNSWNGTNVAVAWTPDAGTGHCPPQGNQEVAYLRIQLTHRVPIFFPFLPVSNTLSTSTEFRMEPVSR
jgi:Flp pilus assembly protein TadG